MLPIHYCRGSYCEQAPLPARQPLVWGLGHFFTFVADEFVG